MRVFLRLSCSWILGTVLGWIGLAMAVVAQSPGATDDETVRGDKDVSLWYGELDAGPRVFRFLIEVSAPTSADAKATAVLTSLDEGGLRFNLDEFVSDASNFNFKLKATRAAYNGTLDSEQQVVRGKWKQGVDLELDFHKVAKPPADSPKEIWKAKLKAGFQNLDLQLRGYESEAGAKAYFFDSLSQKVGGFKAKVEIEGDAYRIDVPGIQASFAGKLNDDATEISGKWKQVVSFDLTWKRESQLAAPGSEDRKRPQNPKGPFPYEIREVIFRNDSVGIDLSGTLTIPKGATSSPLAILISGSGPQDRDETILGHKPFWVIADHFARQGIAVLRFDDRGVGKSQGLFSEATTADFATDVSAAVAFARTLPEIDPNRIGLIGHSEGGLIAPIVAAEDEKIAWIILMAGPGVNGEEVLYSQGQLIVAAAGGSVKDQEKQLRTQKAAFQTLKGSDAGKSKEDIIKAIVDDLLTGEAELSADEKSNLEQLIRVNLAELEKPWFKFFIEYEPGPVLEKVKCPVLALNGSLDTQVDPKLNLPKIAEHLKQGGNTRFEVRELTGLNHLFQQSKTGGIAEYELIEETISPDALDAMSTWVRSIP